MKRIVLKLAGLPVVVLLFFILMIAPGLLAAPITLLIGWWPSMARWIKAWHPGSIGVALFVLAVVLMVAGTHWFLRWVYASARNPEAGRVPTAWRWRWTLCGFGVLTCSLLALCAMVLTVHQIHWFSTSSAPWFSDPFRERVRMLGVAVNLQKQADELQWDSLKTRECFRQKSSTIPGQPAAEAIQPVWIEKDGHSLRGIILIPRRPLHRATARLVVLRPGTNYTTHRLEELPTVLASLGIDKPGPGPGGPVSLLP
jgi:hypothetical protein